MEKVQVKSHDLEEVLCSCLPLRGPKPQSKAPRGPRGRPWRLKVCSKPPTPLTRKQCTLPCSVRGALLVLSTCCCCPRGCGCPQAILAGVVSVAPVHTQALAALPAEGLTEPFGQSPSLMQNSVGWHFLPCHKEDRGLFSNTRSLNSFSFSGL